MTPTFDVPAIKRHITLLHDAAKGAAGAFVVFVLFGDQPGPITRHKVGDIDGTIAAVTAHATTPHANVYISYHLLPNDRKRGRGGRADVIGVVGLVADYDGKGVAMPVDPSLEVETSPGHKQSVILFDTPMLPNDAERLAKALKAASSTDHCTADIAHIWRVAGTLNWPSKLKIERGRSREPFAVSFAQEFDGRTYSKASLEEALAPYMHAAEKPVGSEKFNGDVDVVPLVARLSDVARYLLADDGQPDRSAHAARVVEQLHYEEYSLDEVVSLCTSEGGPWTARYRNRSALIKDIVRLWNKHAAPKDVEQKRAKEGVEAFVKSHRAANDNHPPSEDDTIDAETLMGMTFAPLRYVIPQYVVEGLTILGGRPKLGKSWLAYDFGVAVATGGCAMGNVECEQGDVLYLALEDNQRRVQSRLQIVCPVLRKQRGISLERLQVRTRAPALDKGLLVELDKWRTKCKNPRLIIIDVFAKIRPQRKSNEEVYSADYAAVVPLQRYASEHRLAVIIVTHTRKMEAEDPLEMINGSNGITGAADSVLVLTRSAKGSVLYGRGRDIEEIDTAMQFDAGKWLALGAAEEVTKSNERRRIIAVLKENGELGPKAIADLTGMKAANVNVLLGKMIIAGEMIRCGRGLYSLPPDQPVAEAA